MSGETLRPADNNESIYRKLSTEGLTEIVRDCDDYLTLRKLRDIAMGRPQDELTDELLLAISASMQRIVDEERMLKDLGDELLADPAIKYFNEEADNTPPKEDLFK